MWHASTATVAHICWFLPHNAYNYTYRQWTEHMHLLGMCACPCAAWLGLRQPQFQPQPGGSIASMAQAPQYLHSHTATQESHPSVLGTTAIIASCYAQFQQTKPFLPAFPCFQSPEYITAICQVTNKLSKAVAGRAITIAITAVRRTAWRRQTWILMGGLLKHF